MKTSSPTREPGARRDGQRREVVAGDLHRARCRTRSPARPPRPASSRPSSSVTVTVVRAEHDVVDGDDQAVGVDERPATGALGAEHGRRRVRSRAPSPASARSRAASPRGGGRRRSCVRSRGRRSLARAGHAHYEKRSRCTPARCRSTSTPWSLFRALASKERPFFIDAGQPWGDEWVSSMGFRPRMQLRIAAGDRNADAPLASSTRCSPTLAPSRAARAAPRVGCRSRAARSSALAYETKNAVERLPQSQARRRTRPHLVAAVYDAALAYDHRRQSLHARELAPRRRWRWRASRRRSCDAAADASVRAARRRGRSAVLACQPLPITSTFDADAYAARVERIRAYIAAGDVYQVNLSMRLRDAPGRRPRSTCTAACARRSRCRSAATSTSAASRCSRTRPSSSCAGAARASRPVPIKGTRPRGASTERGRRVSRAELVARSQGARRARHDRRSRAQRSRPRVPDRAACRSTRFAELASFQTVHHLVSTVRGEPARGRRAPPTCCARRSPAARSPARRRSAPCRSSTRSSAAPRGFYTGALGWIDASGDCDLERRDPHRGRATAMRSPTTPAAASSPTRDAEREHDECLLKAEAFFRALGASDARASDR